MIPTVTPRRCAAIVALATAALLYTGSAHAYCRRSACAGTAARVCVPAAAGDCGTPARWPEGPIALQQVPGAEAGRGSWLRDEAAGALARAFARWSAVDCGGGRGPELAVEARAAGAGELEVSETWPERGGGTFAVTRLHLEPATGRILRARVVFYATELRPNDRGALLDSIALHEAGHFLGLAHSEDPAAVMSADQHGSGVPALALSPDDVSAICASYPPRPAAATEAPTWAGAALAGAILAMALAALGHRRGARLTRDRPTWLR